MTSSVGTLRDEATHSNDVDVPRPIGPDATNVVRKPGRYRCPSIGTPAEKCSARTSGENLAGGWHREHRCEKGVRVEALRKKAVAIVTMQSYAHVRSAADGVDDSHDHGTVGRITEQNSNAE